MTAVRPARKREEREQDRTAEGDVAPSAEAGAVPRRARVVATLALSARARIVTAILVVALVRQVIQVVATPPFQGHDEVAHLSYVWSLDRTGKLPTLDNIVPGELAPFATFTVDWPALYTANHPPLYYLLLWPVYRAAGRPDDIDGFIRMLFLLRLLSIPVFLLTIWLAYKLATTLFPRDDFLALTVPAWIAFQPQLGYEGAIVNNDALSIAFGALLLLLCARALRWGLTWPRAAALGTALGLGLLTKATLTIFLPLAAATAVWCHRSRSWRAFTTPGYWRGIAGPAAALTLPLLLATPWYRFLYRTYGDFSAFRALQDLQSDWNAPAGTFWQLLRSRTFHGERFHEYWGYFGWRRIPLPAAELWTLKLALLVVGLGLAVGAIRTWWRWRSGERVAEPFQVAGILLMAAANVLLYGAMVYFGTMFGLSQARYFFPVAPATGLLAMLGLRALVPPQLRRPAAALTIAGLAGFNLLVLTQVVIPYAYT
jgi:4-amino-4-deoxy-L-arabinose transferase-like glycosyltransferase